MPAMLVVLVAGSVTITVVAYGFALWLTGRLFRIKASLGRSFTAAALMALISLAAGAIAFFLLQANNGGVWAGWARSLATCSSAEWS